MDGRGWMKVGSVKSKMENGADYNFIDGSPLEGVTYYRLKMVDKDGSFTYSPVRSVSITNHQKFSIYPNPARDRVYVSGSNISSIRLIDYLGRTVLMQKAMPSTIILDISSLSKGAYMLQVKDADGRTESHKMIVQ